MSSRIRSMKAAVPVVGGGCDDQFEFEFALDLVLDSLERLRAAEPTASRR